ncbi:unnamed protein product [Arctia plantaginis]|uniref:Uncharacterized protein n=1 Tax=Arctia plantaginis TaxID=874455 RepID=A0A8S1B3M6_ARCPL|nr:unnamed protein product [Arctia plantaginis]
MKNRPAESQLPEKGYLLIFLASLGDSRDTQRGAVVSQVKVMNKQLLLFHNAVSAYFSGNNVALEAAVRHFNIHPPPPAPAPCPPAPALSAALAAASAPAPAPATAPAPASAPAPAASLDAPRTA